MITSYFFLNFQNVEKCGFKSWHQNCVLSQQVANKKQTHELRSKGYRDITFFYYYKSDYGIYYTHKERYRYYL